MFSWSTGTDVVEGSGTWAESDVRSGNVRLASLGSWSAFEGVSREGLAGTGFRTWEGGRFRDRFGAMREGEEGLRAVAAFATGAFGLVGRKVDRESTAGGLPSSAFP